MSQETLPATSNDEWIQYYYHQTLLDGEEPISHNNNHDVLSGVMSSESLGSPGSSSPTASQDPQVSTPSKPVRRRSRASKKTPTTLLNANANNFRALVQQFTGCPTPISFANQKGPLNLNFGLKNATPIIERPFQNYNYQNQSHHHQPSVPQNLIHLQPHVQQSCFEDNYYNQLNQVDQLSYSSFNSTSSTVTSNGFYPSSSSLNATTNMEISNGFVLEDELSYDDFNQIFN